MTPPVEPPRAPAVACTLTGPWEDEQPHELALVARGKPFARFSKPDSTKLTLASAAFVEMTWPQLVASGVVVGDKLVLHAARPTLLAGYLAPGPAAVLRWAGGRAVTPELPSWIHPFGSTRTEVDCTILTLDTDHKFRGREVIAAAALRQMMLAPGVTAPLSVTVDGPAVAELQYEPSDSPELDVLEERGDRVRVAVLPHHLNQDWDFTVIGWIAANNLTSFQHGYGGSWGTGGGRGLMHSRPARSVRKAVCSHSVELIGELDGEQHPLGLLSQDVAFNAAKPEGDFVQIWARDVPLELVSGARMLVATAAIADCADAP